MDSRVVAALLVSAVAAAVAAADGAGGLSALEAFVPEVLDAVPPSPMAVVFGDEAAQFGSDVTPTAALLPPTISWAPQDDALYTVVITNPDIPTMESHVYGELVHWLVGNVEKGNVGGGDAIWEYLSPGPPKDTGVHRYLVLAMRQPRRLAFEGEPRNNATTLDDRFHFSIREFAKRHGLEMPPVAGNFFKSEWDPTVDELNEIRTFKGKIVNTIKRP